ncbi:MAG: TIGR04438 family Trp-rich protein [Rhodoferax sp.]|nr:TIGR04438 family Trp-rich protein [Rhodoferax sp.]
MYFLGLGLALLVMKYLEFGPVAQWSWWLVLAPFALAVVWWGWADSSGYTKRKSMEREDQRRDQRRERTKQALDATQSDARNKR